MLSIFSFLDAHALWCFLCCNKHFHRIACEDVLWRALLTAELGEEHLPGWPAGTGGWRRRFMQWRRLESCTCTPRESADPAPTVRALAVPNTSLVCPSRPHTQHTQLLVAAQIQFALLCAAPL